MRHLLAVAIAIAAIIPCHADPAAEKAEAEAKYQKVRDIMAHYCVAKRDAQEATIPAATQQLSELQAIRYELYRIRMQQRDFSTP